MEKTSRRNKHILAQYGVLFVITFAVMILGVAVLALRGFRQQARISESETAYSQAQQVMQYVEHFEVYPFMMETWYENREVLPNIGSVFEEYMKEPEPIMEGTNVTSIYDISMDDVAKFNDRQKAYTAYLAYLVAVDQFLFIKSTEKTTLDGPMLAYAGEDGKYTMLINASDNLIEAGRDISFKSAQRIYDYKKDDLDEVEDNIFYIDDNEGNYFTGVVYPVISDEKLLGLVIIELREDYLKKTSFAYNNMVLGIIVLFSVFICAFMLYMLHRFMVKPLLDVEEGLRAYTMNLNSRMLIDRMRRVKSDNEIGRLADDIAILANRIREVYHEKSELAAQKSKTESEVKLATQLQMSMLPKDFPDRAHENRFDLFGILCPVKEIGGDLYDFFFTDEDHLALMVADVSGNGISAALFMMETRVMIKGKAEQGKSPSQILTEVNEKIIGHNGEKMFVTTWLAIVELSTGKVLEANAGHTKPAICRMGKEYEYHKSSHCVALGTMEGITVTDNEWQLNPGDKIFVYTDGVTESINRVKKSFGADRLQESLNQVKDCDSQKAILEHVKDSVYKFIGKVPLPDDMTMLGFTYYGNKNNE